jgi:hypothetical protein
MMMTAGRLNWESGFGIWALVAFFLNPQLLERNRILLPNQNGSALTKKSCGTIPEAPGSGREGISML